MNSSFKPYTVRRTPVRLSDIEPVVLVDTREQTPLRFTNLRSERATLTTGDYTFAGGENQFCVERKSITDLVACCMGQNRKRFSNELERMRGYPFRRLLVVGTRHEIETGQYRSSIKPRSVLATLSTIQVRFFVDVVFSPTPEEAALQVEEWIYYHAREIVLNANKLLPSRKQ